VMGVQGDTVRSTFPTFGPYRARARVGRGGMATVWRADGPLGPVAVKVLTTERARQPAFRRVLREEVRALARLGHPGIATLLDHGEVAENETPLGLPPGTPWLVQELGAGTVVDRCGTGSWPEVRSWMLEIFDALAHAHARGVLHRDLKPHNVLIATDGRLLLTDFGLAHPTEADRPGRFERAAGTPGFMAPEQAEGRWRDYGPWTDLYASARLLLSLLKRNAQVPTGLAPVLARLMANEVIDRYRQVADARHAIRSLPPRGSGPLDPAWWSTAADGASSTFAISSVEAHTPAPPLPPPVRPAAIVRLPVPDEPPPEHAVLRGASLLRLRQPPLVGRGPQQAQLWDLVRSIAADRRPRVVSICGPRGVGASRLAGWLCEATHAAGVGMPFVTDCARRAPGAALGVLVARALRARGLELDGVRSRAQAFLVSRGIDDPWEARALASVVAPALGSTPPVRFEGAAGRYRVVADLLVRESEHRLPVVWLDDGADDPEAVAFARFLLDRPDPMLVVLTGRSHEGWGHAYATEVHLPQPTPDTMRAILEDGWGLDASLAAALATVLPHPLHAAWWVERRAAAEQLLPSPTGLRLPEHVPLVTEGLDTLGTARLEALLATRSAADREALMLAAVLGGSASAEEWLTACAERGLVAAADLVDALLESGLARMNSTGGHWSFAHEFWADLLITRAGSRRPGLELACAAALEDRTDRIGLQRRAGHLARAGRAIEAADTAIRAAYGFFVFGEMDEATDLLDHCRRALDDARIGPDHVLRLRVRLERARIHRYRGNQDRALALAEAVARDANRLGHPLLAARAELETGHIDARQGHPERTIARLRTTRAGLEQAPDDLLASLAYNVGSAAILAGDTALARAELTEARRLWRRIGDGYGATDAEWGLARCEVTAGNLDAARAYLDAAITHVQKTGSRRSLTVLENERGDLARLEGRADEALAHFDLALRHARIIGYGSIEVIELNRALALLVLGRNAEVVAAVDPAIAEFDRRGWSVYAAGARATRLVALARSGRSDEVTEAFNTLLPALDSLVDADIARLLEQAAEHLPAAPSRTAAELALAQWRSLGRDADAARVAARMAAAGNIAQD
jgi:tetratricopeptide (TPR) repeat protein